AQDHGHLAGGGRDRGEVDQRLAQRLVDGVLPIAALEIGLVAAAAAAAVIARLRAAVLLDHDRDADAHQRADVAIDLAAGADDLDVLPLAGQRAGDLLDPPVLG